MSIKKECFGSLPDGSQVDCYTLTNENGVRASFLNLGAIWTAMIVPDKDGIMRDVVLGFDNVEAYLCNPPHFGAIIGRNANRIAGGIFQLNHKAYGLTVNSGPNNLHSGPEYYRTRLYDVECEEAELGSTVRFSLYSPDGDQGFPGNADICVSYTLTGENSLIIRYLMSADQDTVANLTNHSYFNLSGHDSKDAMEQIVSIDADCYTPADEVSIPTGEIRPVAGTPMDFTVPKEISRDIDADFTDLILGKGYDHNWVLNHPKGELSLCASAKSKKTGIGMEVYTDLPGIQFYTANYLEEEQAGKQGAVYGPRQAYCFETQYYPNSVNEPSFPSPILRTGTVYDTTTIYKFTLDFN